MRRPVLLLALAALAVATPVLAGSLGPSGHQWALEATQLDLMLAVGATAGRVRVAVLDSGLDAQHPSLRHLHDGRTGDGELLQYRDFVSGATLPRDEGGHGTYVAGILAADGRPGGFASLAGALDRRDDLRGVAPGVQLLVARVCDGDRCDPSDVHAALEWAIGLEADIIALSLGFADEVFPPGSFQLKRLDDTLAKAEGDGILVVAAAGNRGALRYPATVPSVLAVGAIDRDGGVRRSSAWGTGDKPDLAAPGQGIVGPQSGGGAVARDGTSAAVPFVVAAAALLMQRHGDPQDAVGVALLRQALVDTARPAVDQVVPHDPQAGHGVLQAADADRRYDTLLEGQGLPPEWPWQQRPPPGGPRAAGGLGVGLAALA